MFCTSYAGEDRKCSTRSSKKRQEQKGIPICFPYLYACLVECELTPLVYIAVRANKS